MLGIGEFSKISGLSNKTLIWYDSIGLLKPDYINEENGYRYYNESSVEKVMFIKYLQSLEFSIDEIMNLSYDIIERKQKFLSDKISTFHNYINLLNKLKESENMQNIQLNQLNNNIISARWEYKCTVDTFEDAVTLPDKTEKDPSMPRVLFFGQTIATDFMQLFKLNLTSFENDNIHYNFAVLNKYRIVVYALSKEYSSQNNIKFHVYENYTMLRYSPEYISNKFKELDDAYKEILSNKELSIKEQIAIREEKDNKRQEVSQLYSPSYTDEEVEYIYNKHLVDENAQTYPLLNLAGKWEGCGNIWENEIEQFEYKTITKKPYLDFNFDIYSNIEIMPDNTVYVMPENLVIDEEMLINNKTVNFHADRESTKGLIKPSTKAENQFVLHCGVKNRDVFGIYKKIGDDEFLFINISNFKDVSVPLYAFRKVKED